LVIKAPLGAFFFESARCGGLVECGGRPTMHWNTLAVSLLVATSAHANHYDPASGESPATLMAGPGDGIAYYRARVQAKRLWRDKKYAEAEPILERLTRDYPRDPWNWMTLARVQARLDKPREAARANEKAGPLIGWDIEYPIGYRLAANNLAAGDKRGALETLRWMIVEQHGYFRSELIEWDEFAALRDDPQFLALIGDPAGRKLDRDESWRADVRFLYDESRRVNPEYRNGDLPAEVTRRRDQLLRDVPRLSDEQIHIRMRGMLAPLHQGHTSFWPMPGSRYLPLRLHAFPEGVYVVEAHGGAKGLAGSRLVALGSMPAEEAWLKLSQVRSVDGDMEHLWGVFELVATSTLKGLGAIDAEDKVELTVERRDGKVEKVAVETDPKFPKERIDKLPAPPAVAAPLFLRDANRNFWHTPLPELDAMYVQVNNMVDLPDETLAAYGRRLWTDLERANPPNVIVDLRHNNGGNTFLYVELLRTLTAYARVTGHRVYALIGRRTYSATGNFVTDLERLVEPVFVGEASSECCRMHGDPTSVTLPYSKVKAELTAVIWNLSSPMDGRREMNPDLPVQLTAKAYLAGEDPALEAIARVIREDRAKK
jgi:hypothetical protein